MPGSGFDTEDSILLTSLNTDYPGDPELVSADGSFDFAESWLEAEGLRYPSRCLRFTPCQGLDCDSVFCSNTHTSGESANLKSQDLAHIPTVGRSVMACTSQAP